MRHKKKKKKMTVERALRASPKAMELLQRKGREGERKDGETEEEDVRNVGFLQALWSITLYTSFSSILWWSSFLSRLPYPPFVCVKARASP
jgi:hypothetical protein